MFFRRAAPTKLQTAFNDACREDAGFLDRLGEAVRIVTQSNRNWIAGTAGDTREFTERDGLAYIVWSSSIGHVERQDNVVRFLTPKESLIRTVDVIIAQGIKYTTQAEIDQANNRIASAKRLAAEINAIG